MLKSEFRIFTYFETMIFLIGLISSYVIFGYYIKAHLMLKYYPIEALKLKLKRKLAFIEDIEA